ncbi:S8 family serine peptidase [Variovorax sp. YR752]|uniref:S8 family peptidase n=1 Tax=Variovorax sp. YR752 TaxID=1884383 RepID=UPI003137A7DC
MQANRQSVASWSSSGRAAALCAVLGCAAAAQAATIDPDLAARLARDVGSQPYPVILRLAQQPDVDVLAQRVAALPQGQRGGRLIESLRAFNAPLQAPLLLDLQVRRAGEVTPLVTLNAIAALLPAKDIRELAKRSDIASIRYDLGLLAPSRRLVADPCKPARPTPRQRLPKSCRGEVRTIDPAQATAFDAQLPASPVLQSLGVPAAWKAGWTGQGVTVAVIDTGIDARHPALAGSFRGGAADWFDVHGEHDRPVDKHGHGTQIAGLVAGTGAGGQTLGAAPQSRWIAARIYNDRNVGRLSQLHRIMAWLLDPDGQPGTADAPQIVLNAWGLGDRPGVCDDEFARDLRWLRAAGMHVVFAAGNGGPMDNSSVSPANNPGALAVGALDASGAPALFSSRGVSACDARPYPDLMAPGELLRTTDLSAGGLPLTTAGTGTSYAAALISGELALLIQARPELAPAAREALLRAAPGETAPLLRALGLPPVAQP